MNFIFPALPVSAESLWVDGSPSAVMFTDRKARMVGDLITIIVSETTSAVRSGTATNTKDTTTTANAGSLWGSLTSILGFPSQPATAATMTNNDSFKTSGALSNKNAVTARITVKVTEIKPNGNLVVSGTSTVKDHGETQMITVSGLVRPDNITPDNTVLSSNVADANVQVNGQGPITNKQRQGILTQVWNFLF